MIATRHFKRLWFSGVMLALLAGCASHAPLPDLATLAPEPKRVERLIIEAPDQSHTLLGVLQHDHRSLRMALLSPQGQRLLTLVQDSDGARFLSGAAFEPPFTAHWLASRLAWSLWPVAELQQNFKRSPWSVRQDASGYSVYHRDALVANIRLSSTCTLIDDIQTGYRLYIIPIALANQPRERLCPAI
jgi:hypothetical protein